MIDARVDLACRLAEERDRLGLSQANMARMLGVSREGLRLYETGQRGISAEFLAAAAGLGVDVQYVVAGVRSTNIAHAGSSALQQTRVQISDTNGAAVGVMESGANLHVVHTQRHVTNTVADVKPGTEHISEAQAAALTALVGEVVQTEAKLKRAPKTHRAVWAALNAHCGVTRYRLIRLEDFDRARRYLHQWLGRLGSMASAPVRDGDAWRKRHYAYIKINTKDTPEILAAYLKKNFKAESLADLSNDELDRVYRYVAGRRSAPRRST